MATNTLVENVTQAISDFADIKTAIEAKGVTVASGTPTSDYADLIGDIPSGGDELLTDLMQGNVATLVIPNGITTLKQGFFGSIYTDITVPSTVTAPDNDVFVNCTNLINLSLDCEMASYKYRSAKCTNLNLGEHAAVNNGNTLIMPSENLANITVDSNNLTLSAADGILFNKDKSKIIRYPAKKTGASYTVPSTVRVIGESVFQNNNFLTSITLPEGITTIEKEGFSSFQGSAMSLPSTLVTIGTQAFIYAKITSISVPHGVTDIGSGTFYGCNSLTTASLPNTVTTEQNIFAGCTNLEFLTLENGYNASLNISHSTKFSAATLVSILNALADRTGTSAKTLTIGATNLAKLTNEEIAIATSKNWNLS